MTQYPEEAMDPVQTTPSILIVDDNPNNLSVLSEILQQRGYQVRVANHGRRGLEVARHARPDLIMLDITMPEMDGFAVCLALKGDALLAEVPVIFISARDEDTIKAKCFELGGADYVQKPFYAREVLARVEHHLRLANLQQQLHARNQSLVEANSRLNEMVVRVNRSNEHLESLVAERTEEIKRRFEALKVSEERNRILFEASPEPILVIHAERQVIIDANPRAEELFGARRDQLLGRSIEAFFLDEQPDGLPLAESAKRQDGLASAKMVVEFQRRIRRLDGEVRLCEVRLVRLPVQDQRTLLCTYIDITERVQAEGQRMLLESQLFQSQKMESLGLLAGGIAHDINNMLGAVMGHLEMLKGKVTAGPDIDRHLTGIQSAADRSKDIVQKVLAFSRQQVFTPQSLDLNRHIAATHQTLAPLIGEDIRLTFWPGHDLWPIFADTSQIDQIIMNLVLNARDAMLDGGAINLRTENRALGLEACGKLPQAKPGDYVVISVQDTGSGMDGFTLARIFEPFFTTKGVGVGTGLGLSTVLGIAKQNEGFVTVASDLGRGTTFHVFLPRIPEVQVLAAEPKTPVLRPCSGGTILLVEDDSILRNVISTVIQKLGYAVLAADSPDEALDLAVQDEVRIDILLTDVVMPDMNGRELQERFAVLRPGVPTLFMSGYTADVIAKRGILEEGVHLIRKPFTLDQLAGKLHELGAESNAGTSDLPWD